MAPIRVLVVGMTSTAGGVENFLMAYCGRIDKRRVRFDFLTRYPDAVYPEQRDAIGKTYVIPQRHEGPMKFYEAIHAFFEDHAGEYDVIWDNECMFNDMTPLQLAAEYGIPVRIAHSHNPQNQDVSARGRAMELLHRMQRRTMVWYANVLWACSQDSARWACPAMDVPCNLIPHAIDAKAFRFNEAVRREVRAHYGLMDCLVVGSVSRLTHQKNQGFLLEAFARLHQREPRARLMLVGDGPDLTDLEAKAVDLGVESAVLFLGHRDDVPRLMQAFDLFAMPSRFEGLGMAAVEAQAAGLPCILSDAVPKAAAITEDVTFLPPEDPDLWAERMLDVLEDPARTRRDTLEAITRAGYEIGEAAQRLTEKLEYLVAETPAYKRRFLLTVPQGGKGHDRENRSRQDVQAIAADSGFVPVKMWSDDEPAKDRRQQVWQDCRLVADWLRLFFKLHHGDLLLVQYPYMPRRTAYLRFALHMVQWKGASTAAFVHSLDSLRLQGGDAARRNDQELLHSFDRVAVVGEHMARYLKNQGVPEEKLVSLDFFDCLTDVPMQARSLSWSVCIAGHLHRKKNRYLDDLPRSRVQWQLYGEGWKNKGKRADITWHGDRADGPMEGAFGLVWDGPSADVCTGGQGAYLMVSRTHRASSYLAEGMPLIAWTGAALADVIRAEHIGLTVDRLSDIPAAIGSLTDDEYRRMAENARRIGHQLRRGDMTRSALLKLR